MPLSGLGETDTDNYGEVSRKVEKIGREITLVAELTNHRKAECERFHSNASRARLNVLLWKEVAIP